MFTVANVNECYENAKVRGWWYDRPTFDKKLEASYLITKLALIHTEIGEAYKGYESFEYDQHLPKFKSVEVELADICVRVFDYMGNNGLAFCGVISGERLVEISCKCKERRRFLSSYSIEVLFNLFRELIDICIENVRRGGSKEEQGSALSLLILNIELLAKNKNYMLYDAYKEKLKYNLSRADHDVVNRKKKGGKLV